MRRPSWTTVGMVVTATALVAVGTVTLMGGHACSKIGCGSQASFDLSSLDAGIRSRATSATLCLDGTCTDSTIGPTSDVVDAALDASTVRAGSLVVLDSAGVELVRLDLAGAEEVDLWYPNGEHCEPTCPQLPLVADGGVLRKRTA